MKFKLMTEEELAQREDISQADRELIEREVGLLTDGDLEARAVRGYLVEEMDENLVNDELRSELPGDAASFLDGWNAAMAQVSKDGLS